MQNITLLPSAEINLTQTQSPSATQQVGYPRSSMMGCPPAPSGTWKCGVLVGSTDNRAETSISPGPESSLKSSWLKSEQSRKYLPLFSWRVRSRHLCLPWAPPGRATQPRSPDVSHLLGNLAKEQPLPGLLSPLHFGGITPSPLLLPSCLRDPSNNYICQLKLM